MYMKPSTVFIMFELKYCLEHVYFELYQYVNSMNEKIEQFFYAKSCIISKFSVVSTFHKIYDQASIIECEQFAL